ncbi:MAG: hypothetical protein J6J39_03970 [Clostridia bacterium]|nr:hypothetical protein [Clostridia bacterium]
MKRTLTLLLAILMILSLTACNKNDTTSDINTGSDITSTESDNVDATESETESDTTESTDDSSTTESTTDNSSSETSKPSSTTTSTESSKTITSTTTSSNTTKKECSHNIKYTFDGIANTWSHTGQCTLCKEYFNKNTACKDENKDNKCDTCSTKMDFGTAFQNVGYIINWVGLSYSDKVYDANPVLTAETVFMETRYKTTETDVKFTYSSEIYIYSATDFEKTAKSLFNIDDAKIAEMRTLQQTRVDDSGTQTSVSVYDGTTNTYSFEQGAYGGGGEPDYLGYKKVGDTEYTVYINDSSYGYVKVINCTYTDTVKISNIYAIDTAPSDIVKFK